jgi:type IV secretion system protein VirB3
MAGRLQVDPLFQGLARPTMVGGVSYMFFVVNATICLLCFINTSSFFYLLVLGPILHFLAMLICRREPRMMELIVLRCSKGMRCINRKYHGYTNSYDLF